MSDTLQAFAPALATAGDREWFADHGRRFYRVRPRLGAEPAGMAVLVHRRDGFICDRAYFNLASSAAAFELGHDDVALGSVWQSLQRLRPVELKEKAAGSPSRRLFQKLLGRRLTA